MGTVTIGGNDYTIYGTQAEAIIYVGGRYGSTYTAWLAAVSDTQKRTLVTATSLLEAEEWADDVDPSTEQDIINASYELAVAILADADLVNQDSADKNIKLVAVNPGVTVEFFGPTEGGRFPPQIQRLIAPFLATTGSSLGVATLQGDCKSKSEFQSCDRHTPWRGDT